ncbi:MAG TPA: hypothetical protein VHD60_03720 [Candidatus Saccharimonadales bacterium]|nr:hypothetical protein [Candidatus Saccharimonadales bacterium]
MDASGAIEDLITEPLEHIKNNPDPEYVRLVANNALFSIGKSPNSLLRKSEVAVILGATEETVDQMIQAGTLPEGKNGKFWEAEGIVVKALTV